MTQQTLKPGKIVCVGRNYRRLRAASEEEAEAAIGGIVAANDVTARDLQRTDGQWTRAKGFDTFCPVSDPAPLPAGSPRLVGNACQRQGAAACQLGGDGLCSAAAALVHLRYHDPGA